MGGSGFMVDAIKSLERNQKLRKGRKSILKSTNSKTGKVESFVPVKLSPEIKKHMDKIARQAKIKEWGIQLSLYFFVLLGLCWWWIH